MRFSTFATGALAAALVSAHPGEKEHAKEMARLARREFLDTVERRDLSHCAAQLKERGIEARNIKRRAEKAAALRRKLGLPDLSRKFTCAVPFDPTTPPIFPSSPFYTSPFIPS